MVQGFQFGMLFWRELLGSASAAFHNFSETPCFCGSEGLNFWFGYIEGPAVVYLVNEVLVMRVLSYQCSREFKFMQFCIDFGDLDRVEWTQAWIVLVPWIIERRWFAGPHLIEEFVDHLVILLLLLSSACRIGPNWWANKTIKRVLLSLMIFRFKCLIQKLRVSGRQLFGLIEGIGLNGLEAYIGRLVIVNLVV